MYAIIETGGKQYRVTPGEVIQLERLAGNVGEKITFDKVLLVGGKADSNVLVGRPYVDKATLSGEIVEQMRGEKLLTIKYKRRKGYRRMIGHRQELTKVLVTTLADGTGQTAQYEEAKRNEILNRANVRTAAPKEKTAPKKASATKEAAPAKTEAPAKKKTATATRKTTTATKKSK